MIAAISKEIRITAETAPTDTIETIYFGGGTPGLLPTEDIASLLREIRSTFNVVSSAEITLEANPEDVTRTVLDAWLKTGINRLSLGIQSFDDNELRWMNRAHTAADSMQCLQDVRSAGYQNFSADLIYGSALQSLETFEKNFDVLEDFGVPHLSCYALTVEEKTTLSKNISAKKDTAPAPEKQAAAFELLIRKAAAAGYEHYEISNFAMPGFRSRHNSSYWEGKRYFGFGPSAHSFDGFAKRRWNIANNSLYIQSLQNGLIPFEEETLSDTERQNEYLMISLRKIEGIDLDAVRKNFGAEQERRVQQAAEKFINEDLLALSAGKLSLTSAGKFLADGIAADLFA